MARKARGEISSMCGSSSLSATWQTRRIFYFPCTFLSSLGCLIDLVSARPAEEQRGKVKPGCCYLFMYPFLYLFITPSARRAPSCALPFDPAVSSMTIVFLLLVGISKHKVYTGCSHSPYFQASCTLK